MPMVPRQKYDVIHYLRESYLRRHNPSQYAKLEDRYFAKLPKGTTTCPAPASVEPWMAMDYGPSLFNTYEVSASHSNGPNIAYKGLAGKGIHFNGQHQVHPRVIGVSMIHVCAAATIGRMGLCRERGQVRRHLQLRRSE
jgi:hypothetical protein